MYGFKMAAKNRIFAWQKKLCGQNLKNQFPKAIFNEMWLKLGDCEGDCEYNYVARKF